MPIYIQISIVEKFTVYQHCDIIQNVKEGVMMIEYGKVFPEVRQRTVAFQYWQEYLKSRLGKFSYWSYRTIAEREYLDSAYRFLYTSAGKEFLAFCAKKEGMSLDRYLEMLGICMEDLELKYDK